MGRYDDMPDEILRSTALRLWHTNAKLFPDRLDVYEGFAPGVQGRFSREKAGSYLTAYEGASVNG